MKWGVSTRRYKKRKVIVKEISNQLHTYKIKIYGLEYETLKRETLNCFRKYIFSQIYVVGSLTGQTLLRLSVVLNCPNDVAL